MAAYSRRRLIVGPALITFGVTLLRLTGELQGWSTTFFSRQPGGLGSLVGIVWLAPVVGAFLGWKLTRLGHGPSSIVRVWANVGAAAGVLMGTGLLNLWLWPRLQVQVLMMAAAAVVVVFLQIRGWSALGKTLLAYAISARLPVATIMLLAIYGRWGTHYDAFPVGFPLTNLFEIWLWEGLVVQMTIWIGVTVLLGTIFGGIATTVARRTGPIRNEAAELAVAREPANLRGPDLVSAVAPAR